MAYDPNILNKGVYPVNEAVDVYTNTSMSTILYTSTGFAGLCDGTVESVNGWNWYRITAIAGNTAYGWVREDSVELKAAPNITTEKAQAQMNAILEYNAQALSNILIAAQACKYAEENGNDVSRQKNQIANLYTNIYNRNQKILNNQNLDDFQVDETDKSPFAPALQAIVNGQSFVSIAWMPFIVVGCIVAVGAGVAVGVYYGTSNMAEESASDYQASSRVQSEVYNFLTPEQINILEDDINKQMQGNYTSGYWQGTADWQKWIVAGAAVVGLYLVYDMFFRD